VAIRARLDEDALLALLDAISRDEALREGYVLKGGNALRFAYAGPRASTDLDLTAVESRPDQPAAESEVALDEFCARLDRALADVAERYDFAEMVVQSREVLPPKKDPRSFPSFRVRVGHTRRPDRSPPYPEVVALDVTLNDLVCESEYVEVESVDLHVSSLDDIIAEKLRSLLQQVPRNRNRPADVFDVWYYTTRARALLDSEQVSVFLVQKSEGKEGLGRITRASFHDPEIRERAEVGYDALEPRLREGVRLPPFDEAFSRVLAFVDELGLPEE
jgi:predicted nucleotidyltransferase component of viral defense system